jgi:hypothetical protein
LISERIEISKTTLKNLIQYNLNGRYRPSKNFENEYINVRNQLINHTDSYELLDFEFQIRKKPVLKHVSNESIKQYSDGSVLFFRFTKKEKVF